PGGRVTRSESVSYPAAAFRFTWSAAQGRWLVSMGGRPAVTASGVRVSAATVVIQHTTVRRSRFVEQGGRPPLAKSTGCGGAAPLGAGGGGAALAARRPGGGAPPFPPAAAGPPPPPPGGVGPAPARR